MAHQDLKPTLTPSPYPLGLASRPMALGSHAPFPYPHPTLREVRGPRALSAYPLTCSFSEYGLLRTTGTLPFPHRSLKTRSFSLPSGRALGSLPSPSLQGKDREDTVRT